jgi:deoxyadenosine/deoxycytidine kinase
MNSNIKIISIEGNIGSGKSTLLEHLREKFRDAENIVFLKEPLDEWETIRDSTGNTILEKFYANQEKYSFAFQMMAFISRLALLKKTTSEIDLNKKTIIFTERSLYTDKYVFAKMLYDTKKIEDVEYQIYEKWFDCFVKDFPVDMIIYMDTSPEMCHCRILKRSRIGEDVIPLEYLDDCHQYHTDMFSKEMKSPMIRLNGNIDTEIFPEQIENWINEIINFIC